MTWALVFTSSSSLHLLSTSFLQERRTTWWSLISTSTSGPFDAIPPDTALLVQNRTGRCHLVGLYSISMLKSQSQQQYLMEARAEVVVFKALWTQQLVYSLGWGCQRSWGGLSCVSAGNRKWQSFLYSV